MTSARTRPLPHLLFAASLAVAGCTSYAASTQPATPASSAVPARATSWYEPSRDLGDLYRDVEMAQIFPDSKTFADARALAPPAEIVAAYATQRGTPGFDLHAFVERYFAMPQTPASVVRSDTTQSMEQHIVGLWPALTHAPDLVDPRSSLIPLPYEYLVPGGRFREVYYWDSYFTMLGLVRSGRTDLVKSMLDNFAYLVRTVGHVPNGTRAYYIGRSQPPYLAAMVGLYAEATDTAHALAYLNALEGEHAFWMQGAGAVTPGDAHRRVVRLRNGAILNRYWDDIPEPRPESYREDATLASGLSDTARTLLYRNIRASAESGWDFSSRWMRDPRDLRTLETTDLAPIDLNALLYNEERTIAALFRARHGAGDDVRAARYEREATLRRDALLAAAWDSATGWFYDVRWRNGERVTDRPTLAATTLLYFGLATPEQGSAVAARLEHDFLAPGGFLTTRIASGQQWDAPNGWPPLEWLAIEGARRYGRADLADVARERWLSLNRRVYRATGKMTEKYDVADTTRAAGGGEYPTQDGFGWTNGVALALAGATPLTPSQPPRAATRRSLIDTRYNP